MEQKKADEKAKREQIFKDYLRRKAEREEGAPVEEDSRTSAAKRREPKRSGPRAARPHSQPPGSLYDDRAALMDDDARGKMCAAWPSARSPSSILAPRTSKLRFLCVQNQLQTQTF